jgi:hypothetical protein
VLVLPKSYQQKIRPLDKELSCSHVKLHRDQVLMLISMDFETLLAEKIIALVFEADIYIG